MINQDECIKLYTEGYGTVYLARKYNTHPNAIRRVLTKNGVTMRSKSEAQALALKLGTNQHPTEGKKVKEETKRLISKKVHESWENTSDKEKAKRSKRSKEQWKNMTKEQREEMRSSAAKAIRKAAKDGSKLERFLIDKLRENGYHVVWHATQILEQEKLEVDLLIEELRIAIEVDGPFHHEAVYSEEQLTRTALNDSTKNALLAKNGYCLIRVKTLDKNMSKFKNERAWELLNNEIELIKSSFPSKENRIKEISV